MARDFGLPAIDALSADFTLTSSAKGVHVVGQLKATHHADLRRHASIPSIPIIDETVEVDFAEPSGMPPEPPTEMHEYEPPDEIVNGQIDLGALTAEFLALGLDPYPRKPGVDFDFEDAGGRGDSPFAALNAQGARLIGGAA